MALGQDVNSAAPAASGSSFYSAMRILPRAQREAMYQIYAFCRDVDDIADSSLPRPERIDRLADWRRWIDDMYAGRTPPHLSALGRAATGFDLQHDDFFALIDGMEMDAREDIRAPAFETLDLYCDRVASAPGRLSVRVFGMPAKDGHDLAHELGRALQMTNILRDVDEDAEIGRLYLPREFLQSAGITTSEPAAVLAHPALGKACMELAERAKKHFASADRIMQRNPRRSVRTPQIMSKVYRPMLDGMIARGWSAPRKRVRVSRLRLVGTLLRYAVI